MLDRQRQFPGNAVTSVFHLCGRRLFGVDVGGNLAERRFVDRQCQLFVSGVFQSVGAWWYDRTPYVRYLQTSIAGDLEKARKEGSDIDRDNFVC